MSSAPCQLLVIRTEGQSCRDQIETASAGSTLYLTAEPLIELAQSASREPFTKLLQAIRRGEMTLVGGLVFEPYASLLSPERLTWHLEQGFRLIENCECPRPTTIFVPENSWHPNLVTILAEHRIEQVIVEQRGKLGTLSRKELEHDLALRKAITLPIRYDTIRYEKRLKELQEEVHETRQERGSTPLAAHFVEEAERLLAKAEHVPALFDKTGDSPASHESRKKIYDALLHAQVGADAARFPNVDPLQGWVIHSGDKLQAGSTAPLMVDTQLARLFFDATSSLVEFDYKPRKVDLLNSAAPLRGLDVHWYPSGALILEGIEKAIVNTQGERTFRIIRSAPDLLHFQLAQTIRATTSSPTPIIYRTFMIRAGIGAHLKNATTGFSVELWVENLEKSGNGTVLITMPIIFPTPAGKECVFRPLLCVGGVSSESIAFNQSTLISGTEISGGLHGVRFFDQTEDFTLDLRFAKPIDAVASFPVVEGDTVSGVEFVFALSARRIVNDERANVLFLSIL